MVRCPFQSQPAVEVLEGHRWRLCHSHLLSHSFPKPQIFSKGSEGYLRHIVLDPQSNFLFDARRIPANCEVGERVCQRQRKASLPLERGKESERKDKRGGESPYHKPSPGCGDSCRSSLWAFVALGSLCLLGGAILKVFTVDWLRVPGNLDKQYSLKVPSRP